MAYNIIEARHDARIAPPYFDWKMVALDTWLVCGIFMDGWAHNHIADEIESFFTPWHALLYSGFLMVAVFNIVTVIRARRKGNAWKETLPDGYGLSMIGVMIFGISGFCDMIWHLVFGIEASVAAGFSPPHIGIMIATGLIVSGPFRAAWMRPGSAPARWSEWLPALISLHLILSLMSFVTQYANPLVVIAATSVPTGYSDQALGAVSILLQTAIFMGWILIAVRRWSLPFGSLTFILALNAISICFMRDQFFLIPAAVLSGIAADILLWKLKSAASCPAKFHLFAFVVPLLYFLLYFGTLLAVKTVSWTMPLWTGTAFMSGIVSGLLSYLILPPPIPQLSVKGSGDTTLFAARRNGQHTDFDAEILAEKAEVKQPVWVSVRHQ